MHGVAYLLIAPRPKILGQNDRRAGGQTHKKAYDQVDQVAGGSANGGQGFLAHKFAHHNGVHRIVHLLKKCSQHNGEEKGQQAFPDHTLGDLVAVKGGKGLSLLFHGCFLNFSCSAVSRGTYGS